MKISQKIQIHNLNKGLSNILNTIRNKNEFNLNKYLDKKTSIINKYFKENNLDTAIIALSGGIDSAISLALIFESQKKIDSPIKNIIPIFIPCYSRYASNQDTAYIKAKKLTDLLQLDLKKIDITLLHNKIYSFVQKDISIEGDDWANGQLVSYLRTTILYYTTSLYTSNNNKPVIIGTTNKDEGAYTGYFGKASDGMVDIQIISDLHKHQIYLLAKELNIPNSIINATPTGDMYDSRKDEEVFGAPYDFVELYFYLKQMKKKEVKNIIKELTPEEKEEFNIMYSNIENMHRYNKHKYYGCSPAVHLDVIKFKIKNGWKYNNYQKQIKNIEYGDHNSW